MAKWIVKYKLHGNEIPWYVEGSAFFYHQDFYYGVSKDDTKCYIPSDVEKLSEKDMKDLLGTIEIKKENLNTLTIDTLTKEQKDALVDSVSQGKIEKLKV